MCVSVSVGLEAGHKGRRERGDDFSSSQLPLFLFWISAERSKEFICASYLKDGLLDLVLKLTCSKGCGTRLLLSPLLC